MLLCLALYQPPLHATLLPSERAPIELAQWNAQLGDAFVVDSKENMGYLVHPDGGYTSFPVNTGQRRVVRYIGRVYNATTPTGHWFALSHEIKGDRITFGKSGRFVRLFKNDEDGVSYTPYGIHSHAYAEKMLLSDDRFRSMGCIIVSESVLDTIIATFDLNEKKMNVVTVYGLGEQSVTEPLLHEIIAQQTEKDL